MKSKPTNHYLNLILLFAAAYVVYSIYKTISAGISDVASLIEAPFSFAKSAYAAVATWASSLFSGSPANAGAAAQAQAAATLQSLGVDPNSLSAQIVLSAYNPPPSAPQQPGTLDFSVLNDGSTAVLNPSALGGTTLYPGP